MKRILVFVLVIGLLAFATTAFAALCDRYYSNPNPAGVPDDLDPVWTVDHYVWTNPPWAHGPYPTPDPMPVPAPLPAGGVMYFGHENWESQINFKMVTLIINYTGGDLDATDFKAGYDNPNTPKMVAEQDVKEVDDADAILSIRWFIIPQPDWEWIEITNIGATPATFTSVDFYTVCDPIPSLTEWGLIGLVVLMLVAGTMVIVRRRRATAAA